MPETDAERSAIREQLERILSSALFKNSKRYPICCGLSSSEHWKATPIL